MSLISIILPVYNIEEYIEETLKSVSEQTYDNWECIIINDGSTDNTRKIVEKWIESDTKNRGKYILYNNENMGPSISRNFGIERANGDYIAFLDSDDIWLPHHLSHNINIILSADVDLVFSNSYKIMEKEYTTILRGDYRLMRGIIEGKKAIEFFLESNQIPLPLVVCKKSKLLEIGGFTYYKNAEDLHLWLNLLYHKNRFFCSEEITGYIRYRNNSKSSLDRRCIREVLEIINIYSKNKEYKNINYEEYFSIWLEDFIRFEHYSYFEKIKHIISIRGYLYTLRKIFNILMRNKYIVYFKKKVKSFLNLLYDKVH